MVLSLLLGDERVDKIEMSKVSNKLSVQGKHRQVASSESVVVRRVRGQSVLACMAQWHKETEVCELRDKVKWYEGDDGSMSSQKCSGKWWTSTKKSDDRNCKISSKDEMISCQSIKRRRQACRSCRVCRTKISSAKRMWASRLKNMDNLGLSSKTRDAHKIHSESLVEAELIRKSGRR